jgi:hypothetical protein
LENGWRRTGLREGYPWSEVRATHQFVTTHYDLTTALPLKNSNGAYAARNAHIFGEEHPRRPGPRCDFSAEEFNIFMAISGRDFGKGARRG